MVPLYWLTSGAEGGSRLIETLRSSPWLQPHLSWGHRMGSQVWVPWKCPEGHTLTLLQRTPSDSVAINL